MNNKAELLKKLKALVDRGIDGEKVSAEKKLKELMRKYDISENELLEDKITTVAFKYHGKEQRRLLVQIIYKVTNCTDFYTYHSINSGRKSKTSLGADVTAAQKIEIEFLFDFYAKAEGIINELLKNGMVIYMKNPDGTQVALKQGVKFFSMELDKNEEITEE